MDSSFAQAFAQVFLDPTLWGLVLLAACYGVFIGSTPGLTATMATALMVPLTYWLGPVPTLAIIVTMVACAIFAGDIPNALVRIPGTPASAAYVNEAYGYTERGQADKVLGVCLLFSVVGGFFGSLVLMGLGHLLASVAVMFSRTEYFWLYLLGLSCALVATRGMILRALVSLLLGLLISTVGLSAVHTQPRFTFDRPELYEGINFIPAMIGLFGVSEVLKNLLQFDPFESRSKPPVTAKKEHFTFFQNWLIRPVTLMLAPAWQMMRRRPWPLFRSSSIGTLIGMLPGAGADIAAWVSMAVSKKSSENETPHEDQPLEGVADATTANSSSLAGAWIPALVFGIPGDSVTAIVIGVLLMKNVKPGPDIFTEQATLVYSIYLIFLLANLILLPVGFLAIKAGGYLVRVPRRILLPLILFFCVLGAYAINGSYFDVGVMLVMGVLGFLLERWQFPLGPIVLGIILGGPLEERLIQTLSGSDGSPLAFFDRPLSAILGLTCIFLWGVLLYRSVSWSRKRETPVS